MNSCIVLPVRGKEDRPEGRVPFPSSFPSQARHLAEVPVPGGREGRDTLVYQKRPVKVGLSDGVNIEVVKGVVAGEKIKSGTSNQEK